MLRKLVGLLVSMGVLMSLPAVATAHENSDYRFVRLSTSAYTNGVEKSFYSSMSHNHCGKMTDTVVRVYYDQLNATGMRVTRIKATYYFKPSGGMRGGPVDVWSDTHNATRLGGFWADTNTYYPYNYSTRNAENYSLVGTYTHWHTIWIPGRWALFRKITGITNCSVDFTFLQASW